MPFEDFARRVVLLDIQESSVCVQFRSLWVEFHYANGSNHKNLGMTLGRVDLTRAQRIDSAAMRV